MRSEAKVLMERYTIGKLLGQGSFAKVYHARCIDTGESFAIKTIDKKLVKSSMFINLEREIHIMTRVRHPNIVRLYEVMATKTKIFLVLEYLKGGELFEKLKKGKLEEEEARKYFRQLVTAVDFCHSRGVYHRDLKPENLLLDEEGNLKVADFGLSTLAQCKAEDGMLHTMCGTPGYTCPEIIKKRAYDGQKADIWSCGIILYSLLAGYLPFRGRDSMDQYRAVLKGEVHYPHCFSSGARRLVSKMLVMDPTKRISIPKIKKTTWFSKGHGMTSQGVENEADLPTQEAHPAWPQPSCHNAFHIISHSEAFDVSGLIERNGCRNEYKKETRFMCLETAKSIVSKLEEVAKRLRLKVVRKERGLVRLEGEEGRKGIMAIDAEVFEYTRGFHMVEFTKSSGDTLEYRKTLKEMRPALEDVEWVWQGRSQPAGQEEALPSEVVEEEGAVLAPCP